MKTIILFFCLGLLTLKGFSQEFIISPETNKILIKEVIAFDSIKADDLYLISKEWFVKTYVSSKDVIQLDDKESQKIIGKGDKHIHSTVYGYWDIIMAYTISISIKDY